ncbi:thyrotropin receptor isoform X2 [Bradysia coprophila]|uniref:thyrotropin receptor isoform X2 n=1 Tax=Bradysia coprophila TaxID=38358 RepID=UPI00187DA38A|nr:thyrotropin receptor isoform X2 [Bradysia coprophila]
MDKFSSHLLNCKYYVFCLIVMCLFGPLPVMSNGMTMPPSTSINFTTTHIIESEPITDSETLPGLSHIPGWRCHCWNSTNESEAELECRCEGMALTRIPQTLHAGMQKLTITRAGLPFLRYVGLKNYSNSLQDIMLTDLLEFETIEPGVFTPLHLLRTLYISHAPKLKSISADVFQGISSSFRSLRIINCGLLTVPDMKYLSPGVILYMIDLEGNQISQIPEKTVKVKTEQLILDNNPLEIIQNNAFMGSEIAKLSLKGNHKLTSLHPSAFVGIENIQELDLSGTSIEALPSNGLNSLEILRIQNTHTLKTIPSVYNFKNLRVAWLTHSFHCCAFQFPSRHDPQRHASRMVHLAALQKECMSGKHLPTEIVHTTDDPNASDYVRNENQSSFEGVWSPISSNASRDRLTRSAGQNDSSFSEIFYDHFEGNDDSILHQNFTHFESNIGRDHFINPITGSPIDNEDVQSNRIGTVNNPMDFGTFHATTADVSPNSLLNAICGNISMNIVSVQCYPMPDALNPCEDVMGSQWLRVSVWIVLFLAVFGNFSVLMVLFSNWSDVTVPKFLMSNLAFADLCMGLYLLLIAAIDVHSMGEYFNFAYDWQYGSGCKAAGFLTVFASHLSVFTLVLITVERWFAITNAINLNKRIKLKLASIIMVCGWIYSIIMSAFPLNGISNYSSTSICLPMEARDSYDVTYLVLIIAIQGLAFFVIAICYAQIYFSLGKETRQAARYASRGEMTVANKMALLVFTNFACWAPIAFFGLTALAGVPLIDVAKSKILLVFFYPLNSCADPYLYAILTAQYRRDLFLLLSKYGFCKEKAQQYKLSYSLPTTNMTCPIPLIGRSTSTDRTATARKPYCEYNGEDV